MKRKITSLLLILSMLASLFTVYSFAADTSAVSDGNKASYYLHYLNTYGDSIDDTGGNLTLINSENSVFEIRSENSNQYGYYNFNDSGKNVYMQLSVDQSRSISPDNLGYLILEMDFNDLGRAVNTSKFFEVHTGSGSLSSSGRHAVTDILNVANDNNGNYFYFCADKTNKIYIDSNTWVHIRCEFSILSADATTYKLRCYVGDKYFEDEFKLGNPAFVSMLRLGSTKSTNQIFGLDNMVLYTSPENIPSYKDKIESEGLMMKVGAENASVDGFQIELQHTPMLVNGEIYCPVDILEEFTGKTCDPVYQTNFSGVPYIHIKLIYSAFKVNAKSYDMGLIQVGNENGFLADDADYVDIMDTLKTFVFNLPSSAKLKDIVADYTDNYDHPYLLVNEDRFAQLRSIYERGNAGSLTSDEDKQLYDYIAAYVASAVSYLNNYCGVTPNGAYNGLKADKIPVNANYEKYQNNGYDGGGRTTITTTPLTYFAFAYQMTGSLNYARAAYDYMLALGDWNHWGPGHFLNCADAAAPFAIAYDWLYDAFEELRGAGEKAKYDGALYDNTKLSTILFTHVIIPGYIQSNNLSCPWPGSVDSRYATKTSNWNAVCASGVIMAALVILEDDIPTAGMTFNTQKKVNSTTFTQTVTPIESIGKASIHVGLNTYSDYAAKLASMNLATLTEYGLEQYAPDGSYVESPGYWSYGTNAYFRLVASLLSATGDDFGLMDAWGMDTTCYFAIHSESSDYKTWNFNDGSVGAQDSSFFFFVGGFYGDDNLVKVRKKQLDCGKSYSLYDILFYDTSVTGEPELSTEYLMVGIDGYAVRSSWDKGAIYAGIIGGQNQVSHGHMDAGSFIYHNNGKIWFTDLGADNYNMSIGYFSNFKLYKVGAEGHNMIAITSEQSTLPYGQLANAEPHITETYSDANGGYAVLDMSDSYGSHVISAKRGLLLTDSRSTVVIQDEYVFNGAKTAYWFGHYNIASGYVDEVVISADGRTAFMISGDDMIRVTIVSDNKNLTFEMMDCYTNLLDITHDTDRSTLGGSGTENNRDTYGKLAIKCENVETLNLAVVIEEVDSYQIGTSYEWVSIDNWRTESDESSVITEKFKADFESYGTITGSYILNSFGNSYFTNNVTSDSSDDKSYLSILPGASGNTITDSKLILYFKNNSGIDLLEKKYVSIDLDIFTEGNLIEEASIGVCVRNGNNKTEFIPLLNFFGKSIYAGSSAITILNDWRHITLLLDTEDCTVYIYADDSYVTEIANPFGADVASIESVEIHLPASSSQKCGDAVYLDNILVRAFSNSYDATALSSVITDRAPLSAWSDYISHETTTVRPLAIANGKSLYSNAEISSAIAQGHTIELQRNTTGIFNINGPAVIVTNGYNFEYVSDNYVPEINANAIKFVRGSITVTWHIDDEVYTETYSGASIATYKGNSSKIGVISYIVTNYADGGVGYRFYTTGWSNVEGGSSLSSRDMIVSEDNCEFWLVNNAPLDCLFVYIDEYGNAASSNSELTLRTLISSSDNLKKLVLCKDVELTNTSAINLSKIGKTLYLNGYTLSHNQDDVHMFNYQSGTSADFTFVGPGTIAANTSRTMFTTTSGTNDKTSNYGVVVKNANLIAARTFADLRIGQHRFIDCYIHHTNTGNKSTFDLWNKNTAMNNNGTPVNLLTITLEGCTLKCDGASTSTSIFSCTSSSYSEIYIIDSDIFAKIALVNSSNSLVKLYVGDESAISVSKLAYNSSINFTNFLFDNGVTTNLADIPSAYMPNGAALTANDNGSFPYLVANNYATVIWKDLSGKTIATEKVAVGKAPVISSSAVTDYLKSLGGEYTYETNEITDNLNVILTPVLKTEVSVFYSMAIQEDLSMYVYIMKSELDSKINSVKVDGITIRSNSYELVEIDGVSYYRYRISKFTPSSACRSSQLLVEQIDGKTKKYEISVVGYLETLLKTTTDDNEKVLAVKLLKYIQSAYAYFNTAEVTEYQKINVLINEYKSYDLIFGALKDESVATVSMKSAIKSVCFNLSASVRIRFYLNPGYTGPLSIHYDGEATDYYISNGRIGGLDYIEVIMSADKVNESVTLSDHTNSITYSLSAYATALNNTNTVLHNMLTCLAEYSAAAKRYVNSKT